MKDNTRLLLLLLFIVVDMALMAHLFDYIIMVTEP